MAAKVTIAGVEFSSVEISEATGLGRDAIVSRINRGVDPLTSRAAKLPGNKYGGAGEQITFNGTTQSKRRWAKAVGLEPATLYRRIANGWTIEQALSKPKGEKRSP